MQFDFSSPYVTMLSMTYVQVFVCLVCRLVLIVGLLLSSAP